MPTIEPVATLDELSNVAIGREQVGHRAYVIGADMWYQAIHEGRGLDKWTPGGEPPAEAGGTMGRTVGYRRVYTLKDTDWPIDALHVDVELGLPLSNAVITGIIANVITPFPTGYSAAVSVAGAVVHTDGIALWVPGYQAYPAFHPAVGSPIVVSFDGPASFATLTAGQVEIAVIGVRPALRTQRPPGGAQLEDVQL